MWRLPTLGTRITISTLLPHTLQVLARAFCSARAATFVLLVPLSLAIGNLPDLNFESGPLDAETTVLIIADNGCFVKPSAPLVRPGRGGMGSADRMTTAPPVRSPSR